MNKKFQFGDKVYFFDYRGRVDGIIVSTNGPFSIVKTKDGEMGVLISLLFVDL